MINDTIDTLTDAAIHCAAHGAKQYLAAHNLKAGHEALWKCVKSHVKAALPGALADAKDALALGMTQVATLTFKASMVQAGIEAAKEAGFAPCH